MAAVSARTLVGLVAALALVPVTAAGCETGDPHGAAIRIEGEAAAETNMPTASDRRASEGRYLALATAEAPPAGGWFATYEVEGPAAGVYPSAKAGNVSPVTLGWRVGGG